jgi:AcrR family transcriptional regulator
MPHRGRKNADQALAMALACGATIEASARSAGVSDTTAYRRLKDPEFCKLLEKTRADLVERTMGMLTGAAGEAVKTLLILMRENTPPAVRLGAVRACLEIGMKLREAHDLQARIAALEAQLRPGPRLAQGTES